MPAPKKPLLLSDAQLRKLVLAKTPWDEIAKQAGCSRNTARNRYNAYQTILSDRAAHRMSAK